MDALTKLLVGNCMASYLKGSKTQETAGFRLVFVTDSMWRGTDEIAQLAVFIGYRFTGGPFAPSVINPGDVRASIQQEVKSLPLASANGHTGSVKDVFVRKTATVSGTSHMPISYGVSKALLAGKPPSLEGWNESCGTITRLTSIGSDREDGVDDTALSRLSSNVAESLMKALLSTSAL